jgi:hypothetical protein
MKSLYQQAGGAIAIAAAALALTAGAARAALPKPAPTPAQQEAAAAKKAKADAQAAADKAALGASMDTVTARYRARAAAQGWKTHPPVAIVAAATPTAASGGAQPNGKLTAADAAAPVASEKHGTAPPSTDVKAGPTRAVPQGVSPTVQKGSPEGVSKK